MRSLGVCADTKGLKYCILESGKTIQAPLIIDTNQLICSHAADIAMLIDWHQTTLSNLLTMNMPNRVGIKLTLDAKKDQISKWYYPNSILHQLCSTHSIPCYEYIPQNFTPSKFTLPKGTDLFDYIHKNFTHTNLRKDKNQQYAVLAAWAAMQ